MNLPTIKTAGFALLVLSLPVISASGVGGKSGVGMTKAQSPPPPRTPRGKDVLTPVARGLVSTSMEQHAQDMTDLLWAVVFLENTEAAAIADGIAEQPRIARPTNQSARDDVNQSIPDRFFQLQDRLRDDARALSKAAKDGDDAAIAKSFGKLNETCVTCHSTYLD